jgi:hypothetical protein
LDGSLTLGAYRPFAKKISEMREFGWLKLKAQRSGN